MKYNIDVFSYVNIYNNAQFIFFLLKVVNDMIFDVMNYDKVKIEKQFCSSTKLSK